MHPVYWCVIGVVGHGQRHFVARRFLSARRTSLCRLAARRLILAALVEHRMNPSCVGTQTPPTGRHGVLPVAS